MVYPDEEENKTFSETTTGMIVIVATIAIYHIVGRSLSLFERLHMNYLLFLILPGVISSAAFFFIVRRLEKAFFVGVITIIVWFIWFVIYGLLTFRIH